jgi:hypothetical protein
LKIHKHSKLVPQTQTLRFSRLRFTGKVLAVTVAYGSLLGGFAWELFAFKAEFDAFCVGAVADFAELVFTGNTADCAVGAFAALHFGAFLAGDTANTNLHVIHSCL